MKKLIALLCMITCIFGLTACNDNVTVDEAKTSNQEKAEQLATEVILPYMGENFLDDEYTDNYVAEYNVHEIKALVDGDLTKAAGYEVDVVGNSMLAGIVSFNDTFGAIGEIQTVGEVTNTVSGDKISVKVAVVGTTGKEATAEFEFADDIFLTLESISLNQVQTKSELMMTAVYDTLMGMGTVFVVLILICLIISSFKIIYKLQNRPSQKEKEDVKAEAVDNTIAQIIEKEELSDDTELVAVIAAAIAASEGATSTDGFVVRSIRKANKSRWQKA